MKTRFITIISAVLIPAFVLLPGCFEMPDKSNDKGNNNNVEPEPVEAPDLTSISRQSIRVGESLTFTGDNFVDDFRAVTLMHFTGTYFRSDGQEEHVDFMVRPDVMNQTQAIWRSFGPYDVPFSRTGDQTGTFWGKIQAVNVLADSEEELVQAGSLAVEIQVLPSIIVRSFQPTEADCLVRSSVVLDHIPYRLEVVAVGFTPVEYKYTLSPGALMSPDPNDLPFEEPFEIVRTATSKVGRLGISEHLNFAPVPEGIYGYNSWIKVESRSATGEEYSYLLALTVRHPLVARYSGKVEVAQIYDPVPVSGCMYGDETGRTVQYSETHEEVREREVGTTFTSGWQQTYTESHTQSYGEGGSEANRIGFATTDGVKFGWNTSTQVSGEVGVKGLAKVGVAVGMGVSFEESRTQTASGDHTVSASWDWNQALSQSQSASQSVQQSGTEIFKVRSSQSESLNFKADLLPRKYGVFYRQTTRLIQRVEIVAYDLCGNWTHVGDLNLSMYVFAPDLAMGDSCPPFPKSNLSEARCLIAPCD